MDLRRKQFWASDVEAVSVIALMLLFIGSVNVFSAGFVQSIADNGGPYYFLKHQAINIFIGAAALAICTRTNYHWWRGAMPFVYIILAMLLVLVLFIGVEANGSTRWMNIAGVGFQPSEFAKPAALLLMSAYIAGQLNNGRELNIINPQAGMIAFLAFLVEREPDLGTAALILGIPVILLVACGLPKKPLMVTGAIFAPLAALYVYIAPYRLQRLLVWIDPWKDESGFGYQIVQSLYTIGSGGLTGMGVGEGISVYGYLPEGHTDFAFAVFSQEWGFLGVLVVIVLFLMLTYYSLRLANLAPDTFGQVLALGITLLIACQAFANMLMVSGLLPVIGVPMPFVSYGGSSLIANMGALGILINIGRIGQAHKKRLQEKAQERAQQARQAEQEARNERVYGRDWHKLNR